MLEKCALLIKDSGLRKILSGLYMFTSLCILLASIKLPAQAFVDVTQWLILAMFGGNAIEHYFGSKKDSKEVPSAS